VIDLSELLRNSLRTRKRAASSKSASAPAKKARKTGATARSAAKRRARG
jgi:hypothetical protein